MASPGNPNQRGGGGGGGGGAGGGSAGFDFNKLFRPSSNSLNMNNMIQQPPPTQQSPSPSSPSSNTNNTAGSGNLTTSPSFPLPASSSSPPYLTPSCSFPPSTGPYNPFHPHYLSPYPPLSSPQLHQHRSPNQYNIHHQNWHQLISSYPTPPPIVTPSTPPVSPSSGGSVLMDILTNKNQPPPSLSTNLSGPPFTSGASSLSSSASVPVPSAPPVSLASPTKQQSGPTPMRMLSGKLPKGRHLIGNHAVYDIDVRLQGEAQPQLEVTPITKYFSDPGLVLGHQIAVNRNYICYGLKPGAIRILNINTALRSLLRGHNQVDSCL